MRMGGGEYLSYPARSNNCRTFAIMNFHVLFRNNPATGNNNRYFKAEGVFSRRNGNGAKPHHSDREFRHE